MILLSNQISQGGIAMSILIIRPDDESGSQLVLFLLELSSRSLSSGSSIRLYRKWACPKRWQRWRRRRRFGPRRSMFSLPSSCCNNPRQIFALCGVTKRQRKFLFDSLPTLKNVEEQSVIFNLKFWLFIFIGIFHMFCKIKIFGIFLMSYTALKSTKKCRTLISQLWHFPSIFVLTLFNRKLQVFKNSPNF